MGSTAETERIIVTGSNIPTAQEVGPNPVLNINRDLINKSGERSAEALIKSLPVANGGGVPISNNATGFTPGASAISLRGLGPEATLVLMDGRRLAPYPIGNGGTSSFFDLRSIPEAAIESIEILKDGASTTYGADAVAGVVNIKMRHDYKGAEASFGYGNTLDKDSGEIRAYLLFGVGDENTQMTGQMNYYKRNSIFNRDRGYSAVPPFLSSNATPENLQLTFESVTAAGGTPPAGRGPGTIILRGCANGFEWFEPGKSIISTLLLVSGRPAASCPASTSTSSRPPSRTLRVTAEWQTSPTRSMETKWCCSRTSCISTLNRTTSWRLPPPARSKPPARSHSPFRRRPRTRAATPRRPAWAARPTRRPECHQARSIRGTRSIRSFRAAAGRVFSNSAIVCSIIRLTTSSPRSVSEATSCSTERGVTMWASAYNRIKATSIATVVSTSRYNQVLNQADPVFGPGGAPRGPGGL